MSKVKTIDKVLEKISRMATIIGLNIIYFIGIGPTAILGKIVNKKFLSKGSGWRKTQLNSNPNNMY